MPMFFFFFFYYISESEPHRSCWKENIFQRGFSHWKLILLLFSRWFHSWGKSVPTCFRRAGILLMDAGERPIVTDCAVAHIVRTVFERRVPLITMQWHRIRKIHQMKTLLWRMLAIFLEFTCGHHIGWTFTFDKTVLQKSVIEEKKKILRMVCPRATVPVVSSLLISIISVLHEKSSGKSWAEACHGENSKRQGGLQVG